MYSCFVRRFVALFIKMFEYSGKIPDLTYLSHRFDTVAAWINLLTKSNSIFYDWNIFCSISHWSAYNQAMVCIENMKEICPVSLHRKIEATLMNLQGAKPEVSALCTDDNIYERELQFHLFFLWFICDNLHGLDVWVGQIILAAATKFFTRRNTPSY